MLIETDIKRYISLTEFEGMVAIAIRVLPASVRSYTDRHPESSGTEGVWYYHPDSVIVNPRLLNPLKVEPYRTIYQLKPEPVAPKNQLRDHRYLVQYADFDVYIPRILSEVITLTEHNSEEQGLVWELKTSTTTLYGVQV